MELLIALTLGLAGFVLLTVLLGSAIIVVRFLRDRRIFHSAMRGVDAQRDAVEKPAEEYDIVETGELVLRLTQDA